MRKTLVPFLVIVWSIAGRLAADDIDAFLPAIGQNSVYLNILLDTGDADRDTPLCTFGSDCAPPFMSQLAYGHLQQMYFPGDKVTAPGIFKAVLAAVLESPLLDSFYLSLMISNHQGNAIDGSGRGVGGGSLLQGYRRLGDNRENIIATLKSIPVVSSGSSHALQPMESYFEWFRYIRGGTVVLGTNTSGNYGQEEPHPDYDSGIIEGEAYMSPFSDAQACPRLNSLIFAAGAPRQDHDLDSKILAGMPLPGDVTFRDMLAYLQDESTDLLPRLAGVIPLGKTLVVTSRAQSEAVFAHIDPGESGEMYLDAAQALQRNLLSALSEMARSGRGEMEISYARDVFNPGTALDNVFIPLFRSSSGGRWQGNLKKLKFLDTPRNVAGSGAAPDGVFDAVVDALGKPAFEVAGEAPGSLRFDALTFWTDPDTLSPGDGLAIPKNADGRVVARGGAGQKIDGYVAYATAGGDPVKYIIGDTNEDIGPDGFSSRQVYFEAEVGKRLRPFDANQSTADALAGLLDPGGELSAGELLELIRWGRGQDTRQASPAAREWLLGSVLHSRPYVLNYGATPGYSKSNPNIRLLFGSGDGLFHIVENTDIVGNETGRELLGFYPGETLSNLKQRYDNSTPPGKILYGVDGTPAVLRVDKNNDGTLDYSAGDEAYVYFGLRRGGASYYALDISNPAAVPDLLWKISPTTGGSFDELGMTFSTPVVGKVNYSGVPIDVVVFAGGYDGGWNEDHTSRRGKDAGAANDSVGNAVYVVNARTGELVWKAVEGATGSSSDTRYAHSGLVDSIPSTVTAMFDADGVIHRLYVGDTGGAVWRVDLPANVGAAQEHRRRNWLITRLADLGRDAQEPGGDATQDRRFFHAVDIVQSTDSIGDFDGVLIQSGDRAHPNETLVQNYLFYIKDRKIISGSAAVRAENDGSESRGRFMAEDLAEQTACIARTEVVDGAGSCSDSEMENGWKIAYPQAGEKGLSTPLVDGGRVFASTYTPGDRKACEANKGRGRMYVVRLGDGTAVASKQRYYELGPGVPPAVVPVGDALFLPGRGVDLYDLDGDGSRDMSKFLPSLATKFYSIYWREPGVDPL